ncbi:MAG: TatD family hydrolase [Patescibacteria group bacterium]
MHIKYFDAHAHIQFPQFDADREEVIARMKKEGVAALVVGTDYETSAAAVSLAEAHDNIWASVGLHPTDVMNETFDEKKLFELARHEKVAAIGECGLDYFRTEGTEEIKQKQKEVFRKHIEIAIARDKALMIHSRPSKGTNDSYEDALLILGEHKKIAGGKLRGNIHFFAGAPEIAKRFFALKFSISFTGVITFSADYDESVKAAPEHLIMAETDCPFVAPVPYRGKRNEPVQVREVVKRMIELRGADEKFCETLLRNAENMFKIKLISSD